MHLLMTLQNKLRRLLSRLMKMANNNVKKYWITRQQPNNKEPKYQLKLQEILIQVIKSQIPTES